MTRKSPIDTETVTPSLGGALVFRSKASLLQWRRFLQNMLINRDRRYRRGSALRHKEIIAESVTALRAGGDESEKAMQAGKVHNLRIALRLLHGVEVPAGAVFSFWAHVGRASRRKGYVRGRELREGCIIPSIGGGLCQLSNGLYDAALTAGFEVIERHAHTRVIPGSLAEAGRDATVFWNYVDLRWKSDEAFRIEAFMTADLLTIRFRGDRKRAGRVPAHALPTVPRRALASAAPVRITRPDAGAPNSCMSCDALGCFRHEESEHVGARFGRSAFLVDEYWPEFDEYIGARKSGRDLLAVPLDGRRFNRANYAWATGGFGSVAERRVVTALRSFESRRLAQQGAERQRALLGHWQKLAAGYAPLLRYDVTHVTVMQNLLPFLWREGHLGGRTFDVLMTGMPLEHLHQRLDAAHALHPESPTLSDFRADGWLLEAEGEALQHARKIITPHTEIAALHGPRAVLLDWRFPEGRAVARGAKLIFPASALGRKGAYEMRAIAERLRLPLVVAGAQLEGGDFWGGVTVESRRGGDWLDGAGAVVLPAFVEHKPRRLLEAIACGVPVIATTACGLGGVRGVVSVPAGDIEALAAAVEKVWRGVV